MQDMVKQDTEKKSIVAFGSHGLAPQDLDGAWRCAQLVARSGLAPKGMEKPESIVVAAALGAEIGLSFMQSLQSVAVINGRPSVWGDALLALVEATGELEEFEEAVENGVATCRVVRKRKNGTIRKTEEKFSMADAKAAGLADKPGPWKQYPNRMLKMRARSFALRDVFPDILKGIVAREEATDLPPIDLSQHHSVFAVEEVAVVEQPAPSMETTDGSDPYTVPVIEAEAAPVAEEQQAEAKPAPEQKPAPRKGSITCPDGGRKPGKSVQAASCPTMCSKWAECEVYAQAGA